MKHPQAFVIIMLGVAATFGVLIWSGSLWGALGALLAGFVLAFVMSMAWLWSPKSGVGRGRRPTHDSFAGLK
jgi:hypothetical protein